PTMEARARDGVGGRCRGVPDRHLRSRPSSLSLLPILMALPPQRFGRNWAGVMVPGILVLALLADGLSRFMSLDRFCIRAWEAMIGNGFWGGGVPLEPSKRYETDRAFGDLASASNRAELREYHREVFTSDEFGYRNLVRFSPESPPDALLTGTSFSIGCGVS